MSQKMDTPLKSDLSPTLFEICEQETVFSYKSRDEYNNYKKSVKNMFVRAFAQDHDEKINLTGDNILLVIGNVVTTHIDRESDAIKIDEETMAKINQLLIPKFLKEEDKISKHNEPTFMLDKHPKKIVSFTFGVNLLEPMEEWNELFNAYEQIKKLVPKLKWWTKYFDIVMDLLKLMLENNPTHQEYIEKMWKHAVLDISKKDEVVNFAGWIYLFSPFLFQDKENEENEENSDRIDFTNVPLILHGDCETKGFVLKNDYLKLKSQIKKLDKKMNDMAKKLRNCGDKYHCDNRCKVFRDSYQDMCFKSKKSFRFGDCNYGVCMLKKCEHFLNTDYVSILEEKRKIEKEMSEIVNKLEETGEKFVVEIQRIPNHRVILKNVSVCLLEPMCGNVSIRFVGSHGNEQNGHYFDVASDFAKLGEELKETSYTLEEQRQLINNVNDFETTSKSMCTIL